MILCSVASSGGEAPLGPGGLLVDPLVTSATENDPDFPPFDDLVACFVRPFIGGRASFGFNWLPLKATPAGVIVAE